MHKKLSEEVISDNSYRKLTKKIFDVWNWKIKNYLISWASKTNFATMILPITKDKEIIYIKEFREWPEKKIFSFPIWIQEKELSFEENAKKELKEETWYEVKVLIYIWETIVANYDRDFCKYFLALDLDKAWEQNLEIWEEIKVFKCSIEEFEEIIKSWFINCPLALSCFTLAKMKGYV